MTAQSTTDYTPDSLWINHGTTTDRLHDFLRGRVSEPHHIDGSVIWDFNNHTVDYDGIRRADLEDGVYLLPFQKSSVWAYMATVLPDTIRTATILTYNQSKGAYVTFPNFLRDNPTITPDHEFTMELDELAQTALDD